MCTRTEMRSVYQNWDYTCHDTPKETLGFLWRKFAGFLKDPQADMKLATGIATFVHQLNMRYIL